jgi:tetratricopeptide (TPR) repeat protein
MIRWSAQFLVASLILVFPNLVFAQIDQKTGDGWCNPAVADVGGNVTIECKGVDPEVVERLKELLDLKDFEIARKVKEANEWIEKYRNLKARLSDAEDDGTLSRRAGALIDKGKFEEAGKILDQIIAKQEKRIASLARNHFNRAELYSLQFRRHDALPHYRKAAQYAPDNLFFVESLAIALHEQNLFSDAEPFYLRALDRQKKEAGKGEAADAAYAGTLNNLAVLYGDTQRHAAAETAYKEALDLYRGLAARNAAAYEPDVATTLNNLAVLYSDTQRHAAAETAYKEALDLYRGLDRRVHGIGLAQTLIGLSILYEATKDTRAELCQLISEAQQIRITGGLAAMASEVSGRNCRKTQ